MNNDNLLHVFSSGTSRFQNVYVHYKTRISKDLHIKLHFKIVYLAFSYVRSLYAIYF